VGQRVFIDEFSWPRGQEIWSKSTKQIWSDTGERTRVLSGLWLELRDDMRALVVRKEKNKRRMKRGSAAAWPGRSRVTGPSPWRPHARYLSFCARNCMLGRPI
jgi:hypothetical protein